MSHFEKESDNNDPVNTISCASVGLLNSQTSAHKTTLLFKLGGRDVLRTAVDIYYDRIMDDDLLIPFFRTTDMKLLKWHQFNFMSVAFDNTITNDFDLTDLILNKHKQFFDNGLCEIHFDAMMGHFKETFVELNIEQILIEEALMILDRLRPVFVEGALQARNKKQSSNSLSRFNVVVVTVTIISIVAIRLYRNLFVHKCRVK
jgi:hemoglobin